MYVCTSMQTKLKNFWLVPPAPLFHPLPLLMLIKANCAPDARVYADVAVEVEIGIQKKYISSWPKIHIVCIQPHTPNGCSINSTRTPQKDTEIQKYLARFQHFAYVTLPKADLAYVYTNNIVYIYIDIVNCPQQLSPPKIGTVVGTWNRSHCAVITSIICCLDKTLGDWEIL